MDAIAVTTSLSMSDAETAIRAALAENGFGVLTEIDVAATLKAKLDIERSPMKILGACNPGFAHRALEIDPSVSLLLPCNVVLSELPDGTVRVAAVDPRGLITDEAFTAVASEAAAKLAKAVQSLPA